MLTDFAEATSPAHGAETAETVDFVHTGAPIPTGTGRAVIDVWQKQGVGRGIRQRRKGFFRAESARLLETNGFEMLTKIQKQVP